MATALTLAYGAASTLLVVSLCVDRDPIAAPPSLLYGGAFALMLACSPVTPARGSRSSETHLARAPVWLKALVAAHGIGLAALLVAVTAGVTVLPSTPALVVAAFFGSVGVLMGWFGQFAPRE